MTAVRTVILGERPPQIEDWLRLRRERGQDLLDEVWEGVYHVAPGPSWRHGSIDLQLARVLGPLADRAKLRGTSVCNIGGPDDFRVPDQAYFRSVGGPIWSQTAAIVVEVVSPDDETWAKLGFYHRHDVDELIIADPEARSVVILMRGPDGYQDTGASRLLEVTATELAARIDWPD
jgi:Uma2 family endonuclease